MWQRFENQVYETVKRYLSDKLRIEWNFNVNGLTPDVVALIECHGCENYEDKFPCVIPAFIFDAYCKFKIDRVYYEKKDDQMKKYSKICDSILVMPQGYGQRPYCRSKGGEYHIVSYHRFYDFLKSIKDELIISWKEDVCGDRPYLQTSDIYKHFELLIRSSIDKCPNCRSDVVPISLIYCSKYDEYYHPDYLDYEIIEHGIGDYTFAECDGCGDRAIFGWNYNTCPYSNVAHEYQCKKCGAIFNPETNEIIEKFEDAHLDYMKEYSYYEKL